VYTLAYTNVMVVPEVLSVREFRAGLAATIARVTKGAPAFVGAHRKPEVVVMSVEQYEALMRSARRRQAVAEALASVRAEGLEPSLDGPRAVGEDRRRPARRRRGHRKTARPIPAVNQPPGPEETDYTAIPKPGFCATCWGSPIPQ
jgi:PHD/YefM family antitoxin component YafN of YafNO toxin-antitoxin module